MVAMNILRDYKDEGVSKYTIKHTPICPIGFCDALFCVSHVSRNTKSLREKESGR